MKRGIFNSNHKLETINRINKEDGFKGGNSDRNYILLEEYLNLKTLGNEPLSQTGLERMARELVEWARTTEDAVRVEEFSLAHGIPTRVFEAWADRYPLFGEAYAHAMELLGMKSYKKAIHKGLAEPIFKHLQHAYDPAWKRAEDYHHERRKQLMEKNTPPPTTIVVRTENFAKPDIKVADAYPEIWE